MRGQPVDYLWWLVSRASGVVALILISLSVLLGLTIANRLVRRPGLKRGAVKLHEHLALAALAAIATHGLSLLGDPWLRPGLRGLAVPFAMAFRPQFTGLGIIGGYIALLFGPSFYLRRHIGARRWRKAHRLIAAAWLLSVIHTLGAGTDAPQLWLRAVVLVPAVPIVYLLTLRTLSRSPGAAKRPPQSDPVALDEVRSARAGSLSDQALREAS